MTKLRIEDLPLALRARALARGGEGGSGCSPRTPVSRTAVPAASSPSSLYRCMACDFAAPWTSKSATPAAWKKHQTDTGHGHYRMVLP